MDSAELEAVRVSGVASRRAGAEYFDNPHHFISATVDTLQQWHEWEALCGAWYAGWLVEDAGRSVELHRIMHMRSW